MSKKVEKPNTFFDVFKNDIHSVVLSGSLLHKITRKKVFKRVKVIMDTWFEKDRKTVEDWYVYFFMRVIYGILFCNECIGCEGPYAWRFCIPSNSEESATDYVKALILAAKREHEFVCEHDYMCSDIVGQKADAALEFFADIHAGIIANVEQAVLDLEKL